MGNTRMTSSSSSTRSSRAFSNSASLLALLSAFGGVAYASTAAAQDAPVQDDDATQVGEIVVTGSRTIKDGSQAPTPVTVISAEQLQLAAPGPIAAGLAQLPAFRGSTSSANAGVSSAGPTSGSFLNLRNLGARRTLVLIDGRRAPPSAVSGATDASTLPQELVSRVDIVTGGASAAYGSDAVAGVVNFILDSQFTGLKGSIEGGVSSRGDNKSGKMTLSAGSPFAEGRGHVLASGSYYQADGIPSQFDREFGAANWVVTRDPARPGVNSIIRDYRSLVSSAGGVIFGGPGLGSGLLQFAPDGTVIPFNRGTVVDGALVGGQGSRGESNLVAASQSESLFGRVSYDLTPTLSIFGEASYAATHATYNQVHTFLIPTFNSPTIFLGNPFIPDALRKTMVANNLGGFQLGRQNFDMPAVRGDARNETLNLVTGFNWDGPNGWSVDGYYERGQNQQTIQTQNNLNAGRFYAAVDAVRDPGGNVVCRVSLTNPGLYPGCVPLNLMGAGAPSQAAMSYVQGTSEYVADLTQDVAALTLSGPLFSTSAGEVTVATGLEYRREQVEQTSDAVSTTPLSPLGLRGVPTSVLIAAGGWQLTNAQPLSGEYDIREGFFEVDAPLLADIRFAESLSVNAAVRYTDYSTSGGVTTWKVGSVWKPNSDLRLRAALSHDIRAPNVAELFSGSVQGLNAVNDTINNVTANVVVATTGNPNLKPEEADTLTLGAVYQPSRFAGLTLSIDYFDIEVEDVISALSPQSTIDQCAAGGPSSPQCANLEFSDPVNRKGLIRIRAPQQNLSQMKVTGWDGEASYRTDLADHGLTGALTVRALASYLVDYTTSVAGGAEIKSAGVVGTADNPRLTATLNANWRSGAWTVFVQERFIGRGKFQAGTEFYNPGLGEQNKVEAVAYTDATVTYDLQTGPKIQIFATVNNLFDKQPPILPMGSQHVTYPTNASVYDVAGRQFTAGLRFRF